MNRIDHLFQTKPNNILSVYCTAGFPQLNDTVRVLKLLQDAGADMIEIGMPYSDPLADGPVIQQSSTTALSNGMNLRLLFEQLRAVRAQIRIPLILMGYLNPVMQYGFENFCRDAAGVGIDGLILPDLTPEVYETEYRAVFEKYNLKNILLVTPRTSDERIRRTDELSSGFVYAVAASSTTGNAVADTEKQQQYFAHLKAMKLKNPFIIGFGISTHAHFENACKYASGAIVGSAFIKHISANPDLEKSIPAFIQSIQQQSAGQ
ncbi:MAG: tryptophan synthase subunit alpha [Bacteroidota bacterium]